MTPQDRDYHVAEKQNGNLFFVVAESKPFNVYIFTSVCFRRKLANTLRLWNFRKSFPLAGKHLFANVRKSKALGNKHNILFCVLFLLFDSAVRVPFDDPYLEESP